MEIGIQISSLKPLLKNEGQVRAAFSRIAALGCSLVQLQWIDRAVSPETVAEALKANGLKSVSVQDFYETVRADQEYYLRLNAVTGGKWLCVSRVPDRLKTREGLCRYAAELSALIAKAKEYGQGVCFHPVTGDYAFIDGVCPVDYLLESLPDLQLCLDLFHLSRAGYSLPAWIRARGGRIRMVHFKDANGDTLVPAGQGDIPWDGVMEACLAADIPYAFAEQEKWDKDPFECLGEALVWMRVPPQRSALPYGDG